MWRYRGFPDRVEQAPVLGIAPAGLRASEPSGCKGATSGLEPLFTDGPNMDIHIRQMTRADIREVCAVDVASCGEHYDEDQLWKIIRSKNTHKYVAMRHVVVGYLLAEEDKNRIVILNLVVHPQWRQRGIATSLLGALKWHFETLHTETNRFVSYLRESDLAGQKFYRKNGFRCVQIVPSWYVDDIDDESTHESAYKFTHWIGDPVETSADDI